MNKAVVISHDDIKPILEDYFNVTEEEVREADGLFIILLKEGDTYE
mgnify:CR=1 FL=1